MTNFFDQFDNPVAEAVSPITPFTPPPASPSGNVFDQFDAPAELPAQIDVSPIGGAPVPVEADVTAVPAPEPAPSPEEDPSRIVERGQFLLMGRTAAGDVVPALNEPLHQARQVVMDILSGRRQATDITGQEAFNLGVSLSPLGAASRAGRAPVAQAAAELTERAAASSGRQAAAKFEAARAFNIPVDRLPNTGTLRERSQQAYARAEDAGLSFKPDTYGQMVGRIAAELNQKGFDPRRHRETAVVLSRLQDDLNRPVTMNRLDATRQLALDLVKSNDAGERRMGGFIINAIDNMMDNVTTKDLTTGAGRMPKEAIQSLKEGRRFWRQFRKSEILDDIHERALNRVGANYTNAGLQTAYRQLFRQLADNKKRFRRFSPSEQAAILRVIRGGKIENALRRLGKFAPTSPLAVATGGGSAFMAAEALVPGLGLPAAVGAGAVGTGARSLSEAATGRSLRRVLQEVRNPNRFAPIMPGP